MNDNTVFKPNLIGFAVGNGVTDYTYDCTPAYVDMGFWHSLYSQELRAKMLAANCDYGGLGMPNATAKCDGYYAQFLALTNKVNIYNIYGICYGTSIDPQAEEGDEGYQKRKRGMTAKDYTPFAFPNDEFLEKHEMDGASLPPCTFGTPLMEYFDRVDVRTALHIPESNPTIGPWEMCTSGIDYTRGAEASIQKYIDLNGKIRMMHYSGDVDGAVGTDGT